MFPKKDHEFTAHVDHRILHSQPGGQQAYLFLLSVCVCVLHTHIYFRFLFPCILSTSDIQHTHTSPTHAPSLSSHAPGRVRTEGNPRSQQHRPAGAWGKPGQNPPAPAHDHRSVTGSASKTSSWGAKAAPTSTPRELADGDPSPQGGALSSQQSLTVASSLTSTSLKRASCTF